MSDPIHPRSLIGPESFKGIKLDWPHRAYRATLGAHPLIETSALAGAGALTGYLGGGLAQQLLGRVAGGLPGDMGTDLQEWLADPANQQTFRNRLTAIGAALGGGYGLAKNLDIYGGLKGAVGSMTEADYWNRPENRQALLQRRLGQLLSRRYLLKKFQWDRGRQLEAEEPADTFLQAETPVRQSLTYVGVDPFLSNNQKLHTQGLLVAANDGQTAGFTSGQELAKAAVQAGVGFGTAYLFGRVAGEILSLPSATVKGLSLAGGLAGALVNTGIFKELGMKKEAVEPVSATVGAAKDVVGYTAREIVEMTKKVAPFLLLAPAAIGVGAGYMNSKMTSPSPQDEEALASELQAAELKRQIGEIARIRALARREKSTVKEKARGIRI